MDPGVNNMLKLGVKLDQFGKPQTAPASRGAQPGRRVGARSASIAQRAPRCCCSTKDLRGRTRQKLREETQFELTDLQQDLRPDLRRSSPHGTREKS